MTVKEAKEEIMNMISDLDTGEQIAGIIDQIEISNNSEADTLRNQLEEMTKDRDSIRERYIKRFLGEPEPVPEPKQDEKEELTLDEILE